jgi:hypothetical protein
MGRDSAMNIDINSKRVYRTSVRVIRVIDDETSDFFPRSVIPIQIHRQLCYTLKKRPDFSNH